MTALDRIHDFQAKRRTALEELDDLNREFKAASPSDRGPEVADAAEAYLDDSAPTVTLTRSRDEIEAAWRVRKRAVKLLDREIEAAALEAATEAGEAQRTRAERLTKRLEKLVPEIIAVADELHGILRPPNLPGSHQRIAGRYRSGLGENVRWVDVTALRGFTR